MKNEKYQYYLFARYGRSVNKFERVLRITAWWYSIGYFINGLESKDIFGWLIFHFKAIVFSQPKKSLLSWESILNH